MEKVVSSIYADSKIETNSVGAGAASNISLVHKSNIFRYRAHIVIVLAVLAWAAVLAGGAFLWAFAAGLL
jgi:hypothetical protein